MVADWNLGEGFPNFPIASPLRVAVQEKLIDAAVLPTQFVDRAEGARILSFSRVFCLVS